MNFWRDGMPNLAARLTGQSFSPDTTSYDSKVAVFQHGGAASACNRCWRDQCGGRNRGGEIRIPVRPAYCRSRYRARTIAAGAERHAVDHAAGGEGEVRPPQRISHESQHSALAGGMTGTPQRKDG